MGDIPTILTQGGSVALLAYLIYWLTQTGAPRLLDRLEGIQQAIGTFNHQLDGIQRRMEILEQQGAKNHEEIRQIMVRSKE